MIFGKKTAMPNHQALGLLDELLAGRSRAPTLAQLVKFIEQHLGLRSDLRDWMTRTDRKPKGCRHITHVGNGYKGKKLTVHDGTREIFCHVQSGTHVKNDAVVRWIREYAEGWRVPVE